MILQPQHLREFERGMRVTHGPTPLGIAAAEVLGQDAIERMTIGGLATFDPSGKRTGGGQHRWFEVGRKCECKR